ncbi:MAG TPA: hypothetical protein H9902_14060 [Candidatus Stackebrandtia faecavium]|nr:hypothetical protein [Candidatus Stackebrandtia faecavium]
MTGPEHTPSRHTPEQRMMRWFAIAGGGIAVLGVIVVLVMALTSGVPGRTPDQPQGPDENLPPLAQKCPPPTTEPSPPEEAPPEPDGERTVDSESGISYAAYDEPWRPWDQVWVAGELGVEYSTGQYFVTETYSKGEYLASILSGHVPAAVNDGASLDLECVSEQVVADVRSNYYPQPNELESITDEPATLGGQPAWLRVMRLSFEEDGLDAHSELVGVALIDVGKTEAAVLYVSIPDTHSKYDDHVEEVMASVYPAS